MRRFNRFYTREVGALNEGLLRSPYSLAEVRVLYELAHRDAPAATELARELRLDAGYLSRILARFARRGLIRREPSAHDARSTRIALTRKGAATIAPLERASQDEVAQKLSQLVSADRARLLAAMTTIEGVLGERAEPKAPYLLRPHRPGDIGWVISRHGALYAEEYGWDQSFEALVADIGAKFLREFNPQREQMLDRRARRAERRLGVRRREIEDGRTASAADRRALRARAGDRSPAGREVRSLRAPMRLPDAYAVDERHLVRRAAHLRAGRVPVGRAGTAPQLRARSRRSELGSQALTGAVLARSPRRLPASRSARRWWRRASSSIS